MAAPFAAIETATAANAVAALANVEATVDGAAVLGVFDADYQDVFGIVAGARPSLLCDSADLESLAALAVGDTVTLNGTDYTITEIQPDGTGLTRLMLKT